MLRLVVCSLAIGAATCSITSTSDTANCEAGACFAESSNDVLLQVGKNNQTKGMPSFIGGENNEKSCAEICAEAQEAANYSKAKRVEDNACSWPDYHPTGMTYFDLMTEASQLLDAANDMRPVDQAAAGQCSIAMNNLRPLKDREMADTMHGILQHHGVHNCEVACGHKVLSSCVCELPMNNCIGQTCSGCPECQERVCFSDSKMYGYGFDNYHFTPNADNDYYLVKENTGRINIQAKRSGHALTLITVQVNDGTNQAKLTFALQRVRDLDGTLSSTRALRACTSPTECMDPATFQAADLPPLSGFNHHSEDKNGATISMLEVRALDDTMIVRVQETGMAQYNTRGLSFHIMLDPIDGTFGYCGSISEFQRPQSMPINMDLVTVEPADNIMDIVENQAALLRQDSAQDKRTDACAIVDADAADAEKVGQCVRQSSDWHDAKKECGEWVKNWNLVCSKHSHKAGQWLQNDCITDVCCLSVESSQNKKIADEIALLKASYKEEVDVENTEPDVCHAFVYFNPSG